MCLVTLFDTLEDDLKVSSILWIHLMALARWEQRNRNNWIIMKSQLRDAAITAMEIQSSGEVAYKSRNDSEILSTFSLSSLFEFWKSRMKNSSIGVIRKGHIFINRNHQVEYWPNENVNRRNRLVKGSVCMRKGEYPTSWKKVWKIPNFSSSSMTIWTW